MKVNFRLDHQGHIVAEGCDRASPLATLLENDVDIKNVDQLRQTVQSFRPPLVYEYFAPEAVDIFYARTHLRFVDRVAIVRFVSPGEGGRVDTIDLRAFADVLDALRSFRVAEWIKNKCLSQPVITLWIQEEYGFRNWVAELTGQEYLELIQRWETMRGLSCTVPVDRIVTTAREVQSRPTAYDATAHIHECTDSHLDGSTYQIPESEDGLFWIDGMPEETLSLYSEYPDLLLSKELSAAQVEVALTSILPGMRVTTSAALEGIVAANAAALLSADDDQDWPARLTILYLPEDQGLGVDPHLTIGRQLATKLGVDVAIDVAPGPQILNG